MTTIGPAKPLLAAFLIPFALHASPDPKMASVTEAIIALPKFGFIEKPEEIPATVVDTGMLKFVPYVSHQVGPDREFNVYGDPANPTCIEIGLYRSLLTNDAEKNKCLALLQALVPALDLRGIPLNGGKSMRNGVVAEVTPHTAPDAYGGWWISVYSLSRLRSEHGRSSSVSEITVDRNATTESLANAGWTRNDFSHSPRFYAAGTALPTTGRVYVKGYFRKDGTYVRPHSRK